MIKFIRYSLIICLLIQISLPATANNYNLLVFKPIFKTNPCISSLLVQPQGICKQWIESVNYFTALNNKLSQIVIGGSDNQIVVFSTNSWQKVNSKDIIGNISAQPVVENNRIFFGTDKGYFYSVDAKTLQSKWQIEVDAQVRSIAIYDKDLYFVTNLGTVYMLDKNTGSIKWSLRRSFSDENLTLRHLSGPTVYNDIMYIGDSNGNLQLIDIKTGLIIKKISLGNHKKKFAGITTTPFVRNNNIIVASFADGLFMVDAQTNEVKWHEPQIKQMTYLQLDNNTIFAAGAGKIHALDLKIKTKKWTFNFNKGIATHMTIKGDKIYLASDLGYLYVLNKNSGKLLESVGSGLGMASAPELGDDMLFIISKPGYLYGMSNSYGGVIQRGKNKRALW